MDTLLIIIAIISGAILTCWFLTRQRDDRNALTQTRLESLDRALERNERLLREEMERNRGEVGRQVSALTQSNEQRLDQLRQSVANGLLQIQTENGLKLDQMRQTVDEKLQGTLERRLGESFKLVSERLELVQKGLGEMQELANGVGDLKRVLTNVKTRGTWGEIQLGALLEQILTADQYSTNVAPKPGSSERVEFAIKLPGRDEREGQVVWIPLDAKFPKEDYERLLLAQEKADPALADEAAKRLEEVVRKCARDIRDKYICPPHTTDFAILYLPIEGLYAEIIRRPGLMDSLQQGCRVVVAGPTTLAALLNALQMGFRTLAIQKRSSEVWKLLGAVKIEFSRFTDHLDAVQKKLHQASDSIEEASRKSRMIQRRLKDVEDLPAADAPALLGTEGVERGND